MRSATSGPRLPDRPPPEPATPPADVGRFKGLVGEILEGLRFYRRTPVLLSASAAVITLNIGFHMAGAIALIFYARELEMTPEAIGSRSRSVRSGSSSGQQRERPSGAGWALVEP